MDPSSILAGTLSVLFRIFIAQPYTVSASSMAPTLEVGDYVFAAKYSYGYSNYSLPVGDLFPAFTYAKTGPKRGDVIVFRPANQPSVDYIKRVIGLPGDTVEMRDGVPWLNGKPLKRQPSGGYEGAASIVGNDPAMARITEILPDGHAYEVIEMPQSTIADNTGRVTVPAGQYFVMGDNRDNSNDSRFDVGFVPEANITGKALVVINWPDGLFVQKPIR